LFLSGLLIEMKKPGSSAGLGLCLRLADVQSGFRGFGFSAAIGAIMSGLPSAFSMIRFARTVMGTHSALALKYSLEMISRESCGV
jgi:hypothetical protein